MVDGHGSSVHPVSFRTRKLSLLTFLSVLWCASPWEHRIAVNQPSFILFKKEEKRLAEKRKERRIALQPFKKKNSGGKEKRGGIVNATSQNWRIMKISKKSKLTIQFVIYECIFGFIMLGGAISIVTINALYEGPLYVLIIIFLLIIIAGTLLLLYLKESKFFDKLNEQLNKPQS